MTKSILNETYGMNRTLIYYIWQQMKQRCDNINNRSYKNYGGRGITYTKKWKSFNGFYEDMKEGYQEGLSIDRINAHGNYEKENCRWVTMSDQQLNKAFGVFVEINGENLTLSQISEKYNINIKILIRRYYDGMTGDKLIGEIRKKSEKQSNVVGVVWVKNRKLWGSKIQVGEKIIYLGEFKLLEDAIESRKSAEIKYFGKEIEKKYKKTTTFNDNNIKCKGVIWNKREEKWKCVITFNKEKYYFGHFNIFDEAVIARLQAELKFYGKDLAPQRHLFEQYNIY